MRTLIALVLIGLVVGLAAEWLPQALDARSPAMGSGGADMPSLRTVAAVDPAASAINASGPRRAGMHERAAGGAALGSAGDDDAAHGDGRADADGAADADASADADADAGADADADADASADADADSDRAHTDGDAGLASTHAPANGAEPATPSSANSPAQPPSQFDALVAAGLTPDRAKAVVFNQAERRRDSLQLEFIKTGTIRALGASRSNETEALRKDLGDAAYERYLQALGQPTRVGVGDVDTDSAAANAGIQSGDEILEYDGRRVFSQRDLNTLMLKTSTGETVATTVMRDGQRVQLYVSGGPLGISARNPK